MTENLTQPLENPYAINTKAFFIAVDEGDMAFFFPTFPFVLYLMMALVKFCICSEIILPR